MAIDNCSACKFFMDIGGPIGTCRRFPTFQNRSSQEWCGEFVAKTPQYVELPVHEMREYVEPEVVQKRRGRPPKGVDNV